MNLDKSFHQDHELEGFCRGCLIKYDNPTDLIHYTEKNRRLFVYSTGLQVKRNDTFTFQLCKDCYVNMKFSCKFKKQCRTSDKRFKNYLRLKDISDIDLCTFLKNSDDTLKFPLLSGSSTPANLRNKDDDNESTCTSIQNFMTDILQGTDTEMPDTEARIIKEVIEEEADLLEDSLDSHWLQDDVSIDTDFRLDFSFSPFSASRSVHNNPCYTPSKEFEPSENTKNNHAKKVLEQLPTLRENDFAVSPKDISITRINEALRDICGKSQIDLEEDYMQDNLKEECINANTVIPIFETDLNMPDLSDNPVDNITVQNEVNMAVKNIDINFVPGTNRKNFYVLNDQITSKELNLANSVEQTDYTVLDNDVTEHNTTACSIDKNLEHALENNNEEIQLEDLLASPAGDVLAAGVPTRIIDDFSETIGASTPRLNDFPMAIGSSTPKLDDFTVTMKETSVKLDEFSVPLKVKTPTVNPFANGTGASTPIINNILFGEKLDLDDDSNNVHKVGQCTEKFEDVGGDIDILEDFFKAEAKVIKEEIKEIDQKENDEKVVAETNADNKADIEIEKEDIPDNSQYYDFEKRLCKICDLTRPTDLAIKIHMLRKHQIKIPIKKDTSKMCPRCGMIIKDKGNYIRHVRTHDKKEFKCKVCTLPFTSESYLRQHMRTHNKLQAKDVKEKKHKHICSTCGATFALSSNLTAHARRHLAPPLACSVVECTRRFYRNHDLKRHELNQKQQRHHNIETRANLEKFVFHVDPTGNLTRDLRDGAPQVRPVRHLVTEVVWEQMTHTGERPHACPVDECGKAFTTKFTLVTHMRKHTAEKPFQCDYCSVKFSRRSNLVKHIQKSEKCIAKRDGTFKKKTLPKKFKCYFCPRKFTKQIYLIRHQERSETCRKNRDDSENRNRSTIKVQMPFLYPNSPAEVTPAPMFTIRVLSEK